MSNKKKEFDPLENFTFAGKLWVVFCIILAAAGLIAYVSEMLPTFPPGDYPLILFMVPVLGVTLAIYALGYWILTKCGIRLRKPPVTPNDKSDPVEPGQNR